MTLTLRDYQIECVRQVFARWAYCRSVLAVLATGAGKTICFAEIARRVSGRVLVVANREELVSQSRDKLHAACNEPVAVEMASSYAPVGPFGPRLVAASVQTLASERRLSRFPPDYFEAIVLDEAHHAVAETWRRVPDHFPAAKVLGVTATPKRLDEAALGQVFDAVAMDYGIEPCVRDGWLVPVRQQAVKVEGLDFSQVKKSASGDLSESDLEQILIVEKILHAMAVPTLEIIGDRPALVFCASVAHAERMAEVLNRYKKHCAKALSGKTPKEVRREVVEEYKTGRVQVLCNCALMTEGFDAPSTECIVMGRPTSSASLYAQILGRATRPLPGVVDGLPPDLFPPEYVGLLQACNEDPHDDASAAALADWVSDRGEMAAAVRRDAVRKSAKKDCLALDFVGNSGKHKLVTAADVLGGKYGQVVRDYARQTQEQEGEERAVQDTLERASAELALLEELAAYREAVKARSAKYRAVDVSPFAGDASPHVEATVPGEMASDKQVALLVRRFGWDENKARALTRRQASGVIGRHMGAGR